MLWLLHCTVAFYVLRRVSLALTSRGSSRLPGTSRRAMGAGVSPRRTAVARKLRQLDGAFALLRRITDVSSEIFFAEVLALLQQADPGQSHFDVAVCKATVVRPQAHGAPPIIADMVAYQAASSQTSDVFPFAAPDVVTFQAFGADDRDQAAAGAASVSAAAAAPKFYAFRQGGGFSRTASRRATHCNAR